MSSIPAPTPGLQPVGPRPVPVSRIGFLDRLGELEAALKAFLSGGASPPSASPSAPCSSRSAC